MKTRFMGVLLVAVLALATVPSGYAVVEDFTVPDSYLEKLVHENGLVEKGESFFDRPIDERHPIIEQLDRQLSNKPDSELTWRESFYLFDLYQGSARSDINLDKAKHYGKLTLEKRDTRQTRALYYERMFLATERLYEETRDPTYMQKALDYRMRFLEENPDGILALPWQTKGDRTYWGELGYIVHALQRAGYSVDREVLEYDQKIYESGKWKELETKEDLKEIGFYEWKEEHITPLTEEGTPLNVEVAQKVPNKAARIMLSSTYGKYFLYGVGGIVGVVALSSVWGKLRGRRRKSRRG